MSDIRLSPLVAVFASVALLTGAAASASCSDALPVAGGCSRCRRRIAAGRARQAAVLTDAPTAQRQKLSDLHPEVAKGDERLQRRLAMAGYHGFTPVLVYAFAEIALALPLASCVYRRATLSAATGLRCSPSPPQSGYLVPASRLAHASRLRKKQIQNGLPDALDLLIVSLEAGLALDQAILKCAEELEMAYPALSQELRLINIETRAGKPRLEAFKNFAKRTKVDDVRSLVAMLVQTDRFGTSVAQALRTHAEVVAHQAAAASGGKGGEDRRQAGVPAGVLSVPGVLRRQRRSGDHQVRRVLREHGDLGGLP